ncbi:MAG: hypothetical protein B6U75_00250 [Desulfurococcales archaeon ex4484_217_1]|nr:MAG: hypothetical protein B6U75_00250 [Desulfurococcales archaeon ex4484_217_1]
MTSNRRITSTLKNLVKNGLAKNMFIFSSENYNLIRKIPEQTTMGNEKISKMIKHIVDFHRRYITEIGRKYKFMYITTRNCVFLIVPINEEKIALIETGKDTPLYLILSELLKHGREKEGNSGFKHVF